MATIDSNAIKDINRQVYKRFPEMEGSKPVVQNASDKSADSSYIITYQTTVRNAKGNSIPRHVRVIADQKGRIIRMTTSR